jgi:hypothetical protein
VLDQSRGLGARRLGAKGPKSLSRLGRSNIPGSSEILWSVGSEGGVV